MAQRSKSRPGAQVSAARVARQPVVGRLAKGYAFVVVSMRYVVLVGWLAAAALATHYLPSLSAAGASSVWAYRPRLRCRQTDATTLFRCR
jgi:hypothetical protein